MTGFAGRSEFFSREAGDYLRELGPLVSGGAPPPGEAFVRLARALRGASMLAGPEGYTRAARQLEQAARLLQDGRLGWDTAAPLLRDAVGDLLRLLGFAQTWAAPQEGEAAALEERLRALNGAAEAQVAAPPQREDGLRSYFGREIPPLADAIGEAAHAIAVDPASAGPAIARAHAAMQSLLGLAGLAELPPVGDVLDAIDGLLSDLGRHPSVPPGAAAVLRQAAATLRAITADVLEHGRPRDLTTVGGFANAVQSQFVRGEGTIPIEELLLAGAERPLPGTPPAPASPLDLASLGERLRSGAAQLRTAPMPEAAALRRCGILATLRAAPGGLGQEPAGAFLARLATCLERETSASDTGLITIMDQAGEHLASGMGHRELSATLAGLAARLPADEQVVPIESLAPDEADEVVPIESLAPDEADEVVPIESLAPDEADEVVPIESLAPDERDEVVPIDSLAPDADLAIVPIEALAPDDTGDVLPIESLAPDEGLAVVPIEALAPDHDMPAASAVRQAPVPHREEPAAPPPPAPFPGLGMPVDRTRLERTLSAYSRLVAANAPVLPLEALIPPAVPPIMPVGSRSAAIEIEAEFNVVPIESLLYRGPGAMSRADDVRRQLEDALKVASTELDRVEPLVRELLDLVPLAVSDGG